MAHPRWPGYSTATGNPAVDNVNRMLNQRMYRDVAARLKFTGVVGRKRKKHLTCTVGAQYITLVASVANTLAAADNAYAAEHGITQAAAREVRRAEAGRG
jgi:hypothetical protein